MIGRVRGSRLVFVGIVVAVMLTLTGVMVLRRGSEAAPAEPAASGDAKQGDSAQKPAVPVSVVEVTSGTLSSYLTATANLVPEDDVKVLAEADGRVTRVLVEEGATVERGALLAELDRADSEIAVRKARLRAENARVAYERAAKLLVENLVSEQDHHRTLTEHKVAEQELAEAEWRLARTAIRSPFAGRVTLRHVTVGQHVAPGAELFQITDFDPLIARIYLPEKDVLGLREGRQVRLTLQADDRVAFAGRIRQISPVVDPATGTVKVTVEAVEVPDEVRPGGFVTVAVVRETRADVLVLPRQAVLRDLQTAHVFVVDGEVAHRREVKVGMEEGDLHEVLSGVKAGEQVVVAGHGSLKDGSAVTIVPATEVVAAR